MNRVGYALKPHKTFFLKQESTFHPLPTAQHIITKILKSSIPSHRNDVSKNQFHNGKIFSQGIDSIESKPGALKKLGSVSLKVHKHEIF
jgi:hypothetical protein